MSATPTTQAALKRAIRSQIASELSTTSLERPEGLSGRRTIYAAVHRAVTRAVSQAQRGGGVR